MTYRPRHFGKLAILFALYAAIGASGFQDAPQDVGAIGLLGQGFLVEIVAYAVVCMYLLLRPLQMSTRGHVRRFWLIFWSPILISALVLFLVG